MNRHIEQLYSLAAKEERIILGLMSGTSLDGLDLALCRIQGHGFQTIVTVLQHHTIPYTQEQRDMIRKVAFRPDAPLEKTCFLHAWIADLHARMINDSLRNWQLPKESVDLLASHGQTIYHAPSYASNASVNMHSTLQIGDGDRLAVKTGIVCISDFRQKHIAAGGEGAPLAAYGDFLMFARQNEDVVLINIGGISNLTYIPAGRHFNQIICGDTGPGNRIMDAYMQSLPGQPLFDEGGKLASGGNVHEGLLSELKSHPYFSRPLPKTTGPELFNLGYLEEAISRTGLHNISPADIMATLNRFSASTIIESVLSLPSSNKRNYLVSGGGLHNQVLMNQLKDQLEGNFLSAPFSPDAKEAVLFALLANECVAGNGSDYGEPGPNLPAISMGKISLPG